jgi:hypothetical protein
MTAPNNDAAPSGGGARQNDPNAHKGSTVNEIRRFLTLMFRPSDVFEIRALECVDKPGDSYRSTHAGYFQFENIDVAVSAIIGLEGRARAVYMTLNPLKKDLLARAVNRLKSKAKVTATDRDVHCRRWLLVDFDPRRPKDTGSTAAELGLARQKAEAVKVYLRAQGWPEPIEVMSGNGVHLLYAIDLAAEDGGLVKNILIALAARFEDERVELDRSVFNAARITKVVGTVAANKGDDMRGVAGVEDRPHRRAQLLHVPEVLAPVPIGLLEALAAEAKPAESNAARKSSPQSTPSAGTTFARFDHTAEGVAGYLNGHGINVTSQKRDGSAVFLYLDRCPVVPDCVAGNSSDIAVIVSDDGRIGYKNLHSRGAGLTWLDVREALEPGYKAFDADRRASARSRGGYGRGTSVGSDSGGGGPSPDSWPDPQPIPTALPPVLPFDPDLLPDPFKPWITDIADRVQCPIDFPAVAAMVALSSAVGRRVGIRPKRYDDWLVVPNLWGAAIGRPGIMKTPAIQEPLKPLVRIEIEAKQEFDVACAAHAAEQMVDEEREKAARSAIKKALKDNNEAAASRIASDAVTPKSPAPVRGRCMTNDPTVEKLGEILRENPFGVLVYRDELVGLLKNLDKPGQESARAFYLEAWNGTGRFTFDRIGRGTIDIEAAILSVIGGIQPGPLGAYLRGAAQGGTGDDGLMQRFQLDVWPDVSREWINVDRWPDTEAKNWAYGVFKRMHDLDLAKLEAKADEEGAIPYLRFTPEAQVRFDVWRAGLEKIVRSGEEHPAIESHLAKYRSLVPSLALLIHLADGRSGPVGLEALEKAIRWSVYLESHARRIFSTVIDADLGAAAGLAQKIVAGRLTDGFALRDVYRKGWAGLGTPDEALLAVRVLEDLGWLRAQTDIDTGGAPATRFRINPKILQRGQGPTDRTDESHAEDPSGGSVGSPLPPSAETETCPDDDREVFEL